MLRPLSHFRQVWMTARGLGCHQMDFPHIHLTFFLASKMATRNTLWSGGCLFYHNPVAFPLPPGWNLPWLLTFWPRDLLSPDLLTPWFPDNSSSMLLSSFLCVSLVYTYAYIILHLVHLFYVSWSSMKTEIMFYLNVQLQSITLCLEYVPF